MTFAPPPAPTRPVRPGPGLPQWPDTWYVVARSSDIAKGGVFDHRIADRPFVVFRAQSGTLTALDAHCPHMGTHLRAATVTGERLQCPLHHWAIDHRGGLHSGGSCLQQKARIWPVAERFGLVFVFAGTGEPPALPSPAYMEQFAWLPGKPFTVNTAWFALMVNGFDVLHMKTVHQRALVAPPTFVHGEDGALHFHYTSSVTPGAGVFGWLMRHLAGNQIHVHQTCYGTTMSVQTSAGALRSCAMFGFLQEGAVVRGFSAFGAPRSGPFWRLRLWLTRLFFMAFLRKDYPVVQDMRLVVDGVSDPGVIAMRDFLRTLPVLAETTP